MTLAPADALATVRQAYQYIEDYQQRVLDAMWLLNERLAERRFKFWQCDLVHRFDRHHPFEQSGRQGLPLLNFEVTWARGLQEDVDKGAGTSPPDPLRVT